MSNYKPTIGLEIHAELKTKTKMFCNSLNNPNEKSPNVNVCPVCMGHPGTLPVINKEAVKKVLMVGKSLKGKLAEHTQFDRKNYFYPDIPKGYQISQYKYPLVEGGELAGVKITRIHLEEDTGKSMHQKDGSLVDYNRAGMPLMELVTEPVISSAMQAKKFAEELQLILRYLDMSDANMEKGQMRIEVNISISKDSYEKSTSLRTDIKGNSTEADILSTKTLGTKVEVKNLNSFRAVERAIDFEIKRQTEVLENGEKVKQETRGWNENKQITFSQREKEESHDYRYFLDPDLPVLNLTKLDLGEFDISELPEEKRERFKKEYGVKKEQIEVLVQDKELADYFEKIAGQLEDNKLIQLTVNYLTSDLLSLMKEKIISFEDLLIKPEDFGELIKMLAKNEITSRVGKDVLKVMVEEGRSASSVVEERGLKQISDDTAVEALSQEIINENSSVADDYRRGKETALQFLIGQGMKKTKGSINPEFLKKILKQKLK